MRTLLFEIQEETEIMQEIKNVENVMFTIDNITIDLVVEITKNSGRFIDNAVNFYLDIKRAAQSENVKLSSFKTNKMSWTVSFKASGSLLNLNNLLIDLNADNIKIISDKKIIN